jgi:DNA polymerase-3 subunit delta
MQVNPDQLAVTLRRGLAPVYFVHGDEPLLVREAADAIRAAAVAAGVTDRQVLTVEAGFDWNALRTATQNLSLFSERRLIELHLPTGKPGEAGAQALVELAAEPPADTVLLVIAGKLEKSQRESRWAKALDAVGVTVIGWPIEAAQLPGWIARRMQARGLKAGAGVAELLAHHMEGNLLACDQEIEKLAMLYGDVQGRTSVAKDTTPGMEEVGLRREQRPRMSGATTQPGGAVREVSLEDIEGALSDNARFSVFTLADATLKGEAPDVARMLAHLRAEGVEPVLVLWALTRELRELATLGARVAGGEPVERVLDAARVWSRRKPLVRAALKRLPPQAWQRLLQRAAHTDRILKGRADGSPWHALESLALAMCGIRPLAA